MESVVNIGRMRDLVKLFYQDESTQDALGSSIPAYEEVSVWADVKPMNFEEVELFNLNFQDENYKVTCRYRQAGRIAFVEYDGNRYDVINPTPDKYKRFIIMYIRRKV